MPIKLPSNYSGFNTQNRGIQESQYDLNVPIESTPQEYRALRQTKLDSFTNMLGRGTMGALAGIDETLAAVGDWQGIYNRITGAEDDYTNWLAQGAQNMRNFSEESMPEYHSKNFGDFGWWMQNGSSVIETLGYAAAGGAFGEGVGAIGKGIGLTGNALRYAQGISTAITMNYTEGVQTASQAYKEMIDQGVSKEEASRQASRLIDLNRINLVFDIPEYLSLFKLKNTDFSRAFKNIDASKLGKGLREFGYQAFNEGGEEILQGYFQNEVERDAKLNDATRILKDPNATKTEKQKAKDTLNALDLNSTGLSRFLDYTTSDEGLTSGIFGALGGLIFQGGAELKSHVEGKEKGQAERESNARTQIEANTASLRDLLNKNGQIDQTELKEAINSNDEVARDLAINKKFANLAYTNAERGTYKQFLNTLEQIKNTTKEEAQEFGLDYDYLKEKAPKFIEDAKLIESMYNEVQRKFQGINTEGTPLNEQALSQLKANALNLKYNYKMFGDYAKEVSTKRNELYSKHSDGNERIVAERLNHIEALKQIIKEQPEAAEKIGAKKEIEFLQQQADSFIDTYNQSSKIKKKESDFVNPIIDDEVIDKFKKEILYDHLKNQTVQDYKDLVKKKQEAFDNTKENLKSMVEEETKKAEVKQNTEKENKEKQEQAEKAKKAREKATPSTTPVKPKQQETKQEITGPEEESIVEESDIVNLSDIINETAKQNESVTEDVVSNVDENAGEESYNPMPEEYSQELDKFEEELEKEEDEAETPNAGSSVFSLAYNLIEYSQTKGGRYKRTGNPDPDADTRLFDPEFLKEGEELIVFIDTKHEDYDIHKEDLNNVPIAVMKKEDYLQGNENPFSYIHRVDWYKNNQNIEEEQKEALVNETREFRNRIFQKRGKAGEVIPFSVQIIDKSIGRLNTTIDQHSVFSLSDNPKIGVAKYGEIIGTEVNELIVGKLVDGVPYLLIKAPNGKMFAKYLKTYKLEKTVVGEDVANSIYNLLNEYFSTQNNSQALSEVGIKDFRNVADEIKKFVYFGNKTVNLDDVRKRFYATDEGQVNIGGKPFDLTKEHNPEEVKKAIKELYIAVNSKHILDKVNSKFSYLTFKEGKFIRNYKPYKKFLDESGFITMNAKANYGTIFGNYVTKIDSSSLKPFEESITEEPKSIDTTVLTKDIIFYPAQFTTVMFSKDLNQWIVKIDEEAEISGEKTFTKDGWNYTFSPWLEENKYSKYKLENKSIKTEIITEEEYNTEKGDLDDNPFSPKPISFEEAKQYWENYKNSQENLIGFQKEIVAESEEKPYIESTKKHAFKRATKKNVVSDEEATRRKDSCNE